MKNRRIFATGIWLGLVLSACNPTRLVPEGEYLLDSYKINCDNKSIDEKELAGYVRQKPNKTIFGVRFHLWLYNRAGTDSSKWKNWLRKNGEEPVLWSLRQTENSRELVRKQLFNTGYSYAKVSDTVILKNKRAEVRYDIRTGRPYHLVNYTYDIADTAIRRIVLADTVNTLLRRGMLLDQRTEVGLLDRERKRIEKVLKEYGYYGFSSEYLDCWADTTLGNYKATVRLELRPFQETDSAGKTVKSLTYPRYRIRNVSVNAGLDLQNLKTQSSTATLDTVTIGRIRYLMPEHFSVRPSTIHRQLFVFPGMLYKQSSFTNTYQHLQSLGNFTRSSAEFTEVPDSNKSLMRVMDCDFSLIPFKRQSFQTQLVATRSEGNLGGEVSLQMTNLSLFGHAEIFNIHLRALIEGVMATQSAFQFKTAMEYEAESTLTIPQFLLPLHLYRFTRRYNPKTTFSLLYNYQRRPQFTRSIFNTSLGYLWQGTAQMGRHRGDNILYHTIRPIDINYVMLQHVDKAYEAYLEKFPYLKNSYMTHLVVSSKYTLIRDLPQIKKDNFFFVRANFETAGLLLNTFFNMADKKKTGNNEEKLPHKILNNPFSQFVKIDGDFRYYHTINSNNRMVSRLFMGMGIPYGNSRITDAAGNVTASMPFEKKYYSGGMLSMRGWRMRSLGPGSYKDSVTVAAYPNNTGDIKLEANLEYRFKLVWIFEGAVFIDAGNVWDSHKDNSRKGADFDIKRFYREIALDAGFGLRLDFKYAIACFDLGMKLYDPADNFGWVFARKTGRPRLFNFSIGIGYPF